MARNNRPGEFEQVVLFSLAGLGSESTGGQVYDALVRATGREVSLAAVYIVLSRMGEKGWVSIQTEAPPVGEGGKPRRRFSLTRKGAQVLREMRSQYNRLWEWARTHPGLGAE